MPKKLLALLALVGALAVAAGCSTVQSFTPNQFTDRPAVAPDPPHDGLLRLRGFS